MEEKLRSILDNAKNKLSNCTKEADLLNIKSELLGKNSALQELLTGLKDMSIEDKKTYGSVINNLKNEINELITNKANDIEQAKVNAILEKESVDVTLPATKITSGAPHIIEKVIETIEETLMSMGYDVYDGPEIEEDRFNFELLNVPKGHPARDAQDTFYVKREELLLRSQTSGVQARVMLENNGEKPIRMICPGKTYRRDSDDASHSHQFTQIEGLLVDKTASLTDLKGTFDIIAKKVFGDKVETRFRPSYYPFTEPSVETDVSCFSCGGSGCPICKNTGWITISGAGIVHPDVLRKCGYDPEIWHGFAFGFGAERMAMLKYGINDIRAFYENDLRANALFDRKDSDNND